MKKIFTIIIGLTCIVNVASSKPVLTNSKCLIASLFDNGTGTVSPGNTTYQLAYYPDRGLDEVTEEDFWYIKNINGTEYTFQNALTLKYISYDPSAVDRAALVMSDSLMLNKSTSFSLELKTTNNISYYLIHPVLNYDKVWDRRTQNQNEIYPVGLYNASGASIQCFVFYDADGNSVIDDGKVPITLPTSTTTLGAFTGYMTNFTINGKIPAVDTSKKEFYITVPEAEMNKVQYPKFKFTLTNPAYKLYVNNIPVASGEEVRYYFNNETIPIEIRNGTSVVTSGTLICTCLPTVQIYADNTIGSVYSLGRIAVTDGVIANPTAVLLSNLRVRGDYAARVEKKAYSIKLKDLDGETALKYSFLGLRSDNSWVLDAMYIDPARMRNRVSTDLWLDFSQPTYYATDEPNMVNGTHGKFVEVFLNDSYNGLYCLTEKIDRKQLNLKKLKYSLDSSTVTQRGGLYKASSWSIGTHLGNPVTWGTNILPDYNNQSESWTAFDVKYPDLGDGEPIDWKPVYDAVRIPYWNTSDDEFFAKYADYFDMPVFRDYYLFLDLMLATDNHGKNYYLSVYDQTVSPMLSLTPWDLDGVWGRRWDGTSNITFPNQSFETYIINNEPRQNNLYLRLMDKNTDVFNSELKNRYRELRGTYFNLNSIMNRFYKYNELFKLSGSDVREKKRWYLADINNEMTFLSNWIKARLNYLDNQYLGSPYTDLTEINSNKLKFAPNPVVDMLTVYNLNVGDIVEIVNLQAKVLLKTIVNSDKLSINMNSFESGIYLIKVGGNVSKVIKK